MVTQEMLRRLGRLLREARTAKKLSQEEVAEMIARTQGQYSDIERAYARPGSTRGSVPDDEFLSLVSGVLDIPIQDLHAALGRVPITYELDPDTLALAEGYSGLPDYARRIVDNAYKSASELALEMDRESSIGKRAE